MQRKATNFNSRGYEGELSRLPITISRPPIFRLWFRQIPATFTEIFKDYINLKGALKDSKKVDYCNVVFRDCCSCLVAV